MHYSRYLMHSGVEGLIRPALTVSIQTSNARTYLQTRITCTCSQGAARDYEHDMALEGGSLTQIGALDLWDGVVLQLCLEGVQGVKPVALSWRRSTRPACPLHGAGLHASCPRQRLSTV